MTHGIEEAMRVHRLDALLFPMSRGPALAAPGGFPSIIVPFGAVPRAAKPPFPSGFAPPPWPFGVTFPGAACSEPRLLELAYAFEQATRGRVPPWLRRGNARGTVCPCRVSESETTCPGA